MDDAAYIVIGMFIGAAFVAILMAFGLGSRDECRAANPGYECAIGWVRGEAFQ